MPAYGQLYVTTHPEISTIVAVTARRLIWLTLLSKYPQNIKIGNEIMVLVDVSVLEYILASFNY